MTTDLAEILWSVHEPAFPVGRVADDESDFAQAVARAQPPITRLVHRLLSWPGDGSEVSDIVQDVFLAAWIHRRRFRGEAAWTTWLTRIAINKARSHVRRRVRREALLAALPWLRRDLHEPDPAQDADVSARVRAIVARLPHSDREVIVLRYLEERDIEEIATMLGLRRSAVDSRLTRARKRLRELLDAAGLEEATR